MVFVLGMNQNHDILFSGRNHKQIDQQGIF